MRKSLIVVIVLAQALMSLHASDGFLSRKERKAIVADLTGRKFYLTTPQYPLLANDRVRVLDGIVSKAAMLERRPENAPATTHYMHSVTIEVLGTDGAPRLIVEIAFTRVEDKEHLETLFQEVFSETPLEDQFDWSPEIKTAVRERRVELGMTQDMVLLALGGLPFDVDQELLDDGRLRETWKVQIKEDTRNIFMQRRSVGFATASGRASGGVASATAIGVGAGSASYVFGGLPPEFLHVVFDDGVVVARKTRFVE